MRVYIVHLESNDVIVCRSRYEAEEFIRIFAHGSISARIVEQRVYETVQSVF